MQIYLEGCYLYGFDQQKAFKARYMASNPSVSLDIGKHDKNNVEYGNNVTTKS